MTKLWSVALREIVGLYWLYNGVGKAGNYSWVRDVLLRAASDNPLPLYRDFLVRLVVPNWQVITALETIGEAVVGLCFLLGLFMRLSGFVGIFMSVNLTLTLGFSFPDVGLVFWYFAFIVLLNTTILLDDSGRSFGLDRLLLKRVRPNQILSIII